MNADAFAPPRTPSADAGALRQLEAGRRSRMLRTMFYVGLLAIELVAVLTAFAIASVFFLERSLSHNSIVAGSLTISMFVVATFYARVYTYRAVVSLHAGVTRLLHSWLVTLGLVLALFFTGKISADFSRGLLLTTGALGAIFLMFTRAFAVRLVRTRLHRVFVGELLVDDGLSISAPPSFDRVSTADLALRPDAHDPINLHNFSCLTAGYDRIVVACPQERRASWALYLQSVGCNGELWMPELESVPIRDSTHRHLPTVPVAVGPLDLPDRVMKRLLDLAITVPVIVALSPLLAIVAIAIKLDSRGPVLFRQQRMGRNSRLFEVFKFRSMRQELSDFSGTRSASRDDDRITRVGRIIRATSIDELPQLFNVLQGDMSLVGPRPHALGSRAGDDLFWQVDPRYWLRHAIKPGMTGLAQVRGFRGATDVRDDLSNRLHSDLEYVANWSILTDLLILLRTAGVVVHAKAF